MKIEFLLSVFLSFFHIRAEEADKENLDLRFSRQGPDVNVTAPKMLIKIYQANLLLEFP